MSTLFQGANRGRITTPSSMWVSASSTSALARPIPRILSSFFCKRSRAMSAASSKQTSGASAESQVGLNAPISPASALPQPVLSSSSSGWIKEASNRAASSAGRRRVPNARHSSPKAA